MELFVSPINMRTHTDSMAREIAAQLTEGIMGIMLSSTLDLPGENSDTAAAIGGVANQHLRKRNRKKLIRKLVRGQPSPSVTADNLVDTILNRLNTNKPNSQVLSEIRASMNRNMRQFRLSRKRAIQGAFGEDKDTLTSREIEKLNEELQTLRARSGAILSRDIAQKVYQVNTEDVVENYGQSVPELTSDLDDILNKGKVEKIPQAITTLRSIRRNGVGNLADGINKLCNSGPLWRKIMAHVGTFGVCSGFTLGNNIGNAIRDREVQMDAVIFSLEMFLYMWNILMFPVAPVQSSIFLGIHTGTFLIRGHLESNKGRVLEPK